MLLSLLVEVFCVGWWIGFVLWTGAHVGVAVRPCGLCVGCVTGVFEFVCEILYLGLFFVMGLFFVACGVLGSGV